MKKKKPGYNFEQVKNFKRLYSGKHRSGTCVCGHLAEDHHGHMVMNLLYYRKTGEYRYPGECEYYGCNEESGLDDKGQFHCGQYKDSKA